MCVCVHARAAKRLVQKSCMVDIEKTAPILQAIFTNFPNSSTVFRGYFCSEISGYILVQKDLLRKQDPNKCRSLKEKKKKKRMLCKAY